MANSATQWRDVFTSYPQLRIEIGATNAGFLKYTFRWMFNDEWRDAFIVIDCLDDSTFIRNGAGDMILVRGSEASFLPIEGHNLIPLVDLYEVDMHCYRHLEDEFKQFIEYWASNGNASAKVALNQEDYLE